ncbi:TIGR04211 family SH3 domain-containing protein [Methylomonas sp. WSC-6]|uniref:TIGR04211 family SH3 domain-containing protein n=1 Tax=Methylomonas rivi TaxID=2952226 RepID=A0ABT1U213_9GAMM|nr:TIGR04211 family SH3 domain-containing protein [Methylomonas sp. WSC-6]MCQ8127676.1 TIGR04211 family SH3 domain-containing protein [Methylomonas sp. WSC-6]
MKSAAVKKAIASFLVLLATSSLAQARTGYVTDSIDIPLRSGESERSRIVKMLPNGMALTLLGDNTENGYTYVQAANGSEGYILTRYISGEPISRTQLEAASKKLEALQEENKALKTAQANGQEISGERDRLNAELNELKQTAANAIQLKQQRDQLQERVITVERELQQLKRENQALTDNTNQDWFLYGGGLSLFGVLLGFILPKLSWRRRSSGWDTF